MNVIQEAVQESSMLVRAIKEEDFAAKFENGELMITFPKTEPEKIEEKES